MVAVVGRNDGTELVEGLDRVVMGLLRLRHLKLLPSETNATTVNTRGARKKERKRWGKGRKGTVYGLYL